MPDENVLTFRVGSERLSLPASDVAEIIRPRAMTRVPHSPANLLGVINLRGAVLPVVSLAGLLGHDVAGASPSARIVVTSARPPVGLLVDEVSALTQSAEERKVDLKVLLAQQFGTPLRRSSAASSGGIFEATTPLPQAGTRDNLALIAFELSGQEYALPLDKVVEVSVVPGDIADVPGTDQAMIGVSERGGGLLPLVSLHVLLGLPAHSGSRAQRRVVITRIGRALVGLVVDGMKEILRVSDDSVDPVPPVLTRGKGEARIDAICRLESGRRLVSILSPARLFDTETSARILADAEQGTAQMSSTGSGLSQSEQFVVFQLGDEHYGLPIAAVDEVVRRPDKLTRVPRAPAFVEGVMNLRGKIVPVINQRQRFAVTDADGGNSRRIVIVTIDTLQAGFVVDAVSEILSVAVSDLNSAPNLMTSEDVPIFDRIANIEREGRMILLIDAKTLLDRAERDVLSAIAAEAAPAS
ncbi:MAG: chemotaxis protein CheW [Rhodospirillales bacterium]|nr:chemotaxis protein CheW [Rhodospirillales bacterium]